MKNLKLVLVCLAGLLHDIGKFGQRAGAPCSSNLEQEYCPQAKAGYSTHKHVLYTDYFIEHDLPLPPELEQSRSVLARLASAHHKPDEGSLEETCLRDAEWLSSGGDRIEGESGGDYRKARLESIFNSVKLRAGTTYAGGLRYPLCNLEDREAIFPVPQEEAGRTQYSDLWKGFLKSLASLPLHLGVRHYMHSLQSLLECWTWSIASSTYNTKADISLFDHCYTTASIAQALYVFRTSGKKGKELLLFGGSLSGIQKYIFTSGEHAGRGAGRLLRARSFVIQMLTRSIWFSLLERCGLSSVARIMDAGGRFILLLPATDEVLSQVKTLEIEAERWLKEEYQGVVRATFGSMPLSASPRQTSDLQMQNFQRVFLAFNDLMDRSKLQPFSRLMEEGLEAVLPIKSADYAPHGECEVCGLRPAVKIEEDRALCPECDKLISQIGRRLPTAQYAVLSHAHDGFPLFGDLWIRLCESDPGTGAKEASDILSFKGREKYTALPVAGYIPRIAEDELEAWRREGRFPLQNGQCLCDGEELRPGSAKTFSVLASLSRIPDRDGRWRSSPMLAVCKADVDNLGMLFSIGFDRDDGTSLLSISRFASLSRMLQHFFSSYLVRLVEEEYPNIYVVFAGGDDLFVIGPWAEAIDFAGRMHREFKRFCGSHPDVTLSCGLPLVRSRLPVFSMKAMAEELLEQSKHHVKTGKEKGADADKDAVSLLGVTCSWDDFDDCMAAGRRLERLCLDQAVTQGFVRRLLGYCREYRKFKQGDLKSGLCLSHLQYDMVRNCKEKAMSREDLLWLKGLSGREFLNAEMGISWALYRTRQS